MKRFKSVDDYVADLDQWQSEVMKLREILNSTDLHETVKWGAPCYTYNGKNVVGLAAFKNYFGIWFHQGALLSDPQGVLINAQEGKTQALRQWRMSHGKEIKVRAIKAYVKEAIELVESGQEIKPARGKPVVIDPLLDSAFSKNKKAHAAFKKMKMGCQREYADYINEAKREETKVRRIAKILPMIIEGGGLNDKYR